MGTLQFSVDDFERVGTSPWEGVRNHEAKNMMMQMRIGDRVGLVSWWLWKLGS